MKQTLPFCEWCNTEPELQIPAAFTSTDKYPVIIRCPKCGVFVYSGSGKESVIKLWSQLQTSIAEDHQALWHKVIRDYYAGRLNNET